MHRGSKPVRYGAFRPRGTGKRRDNEAQPQWREVDQRGSNPHRHRRRLLRRVALTISALVTLGGFGALSPKEPFFETLGFTHAVVEKSGLNLKATECHDRGRTYFRRIASYPRLQDGRDAEVVILQRCAKSLEAFAAL
jgi:hypothetical protein